MPGIRHIIMDMEYRMVTRQFPPRIRVYGIFSVENRLFVDYAHRPGSNPWWVVGIDPSQLPHGFHGSFWDPTNAVLIATDLKSFRKVAEGRQYGELHNALSSGDLIIINNPDVKIRWPIPLSRATKDFIRKEIVESV